MIQEPHINSHLEQLISDLRKSNDRIKELDNYKIDVEILDNSVQLHIHGQSDFAIVSYEGKYGLQDLVHAYFKSIKNNDEFDGANDAYQWATDNLSEYGEIIPFVLERLSETFTITEDCKEVQ